MNNNKKSVTGQINVDAVLREKLGKKYFLVPRCLISWLEKTIHQDEMNEYQMGRAAGKVGIDWLDESVDYLEMDIRVHGMENLPDDGEGKHYTFVSNHPLGGLDGIALGQVLCHRYDSRLRYIVNDMLMQFSGLAPLCVPVNKVGSQSRNLIAAMDGAFSSENNILMFPAGLCSRKQKDGSIRDLDWKKTFITQSVKWKRDVIPVHFLGQNSDRFYRIADWCKRLHLKVNIAMLYLPDEMYRQRGAKLDIIFGKPIPWQTFDSSKTPTEWAQVVRGQVYDL